MKTKDKLRKGSQLGVGKKNIIVRIEIVDSLLDGCEGWSIDGRY